MLSTSFVGFLGLALSALSITHAISRPTKIELTNNGYTKVLVAIHEDVPEDKTLIDKIKDMFTEASSYMYVATRKRAFFKDVIILVPSTWTDDQTYTAATSEIYTNADVVVAEMTPRYRDTPYSRTYSGCGHQGIRIHLTPTFLTDPGSKHKYGPAGRVLVHEWGHFRWGVFDEYPMEGEQEFYFSPTTGAYEAVRCNIHMYVPIVIVDAAGHLVRFCRSDMLDPKTGRLPDDCHVSVGSKTYTRRNRGISASVMDRQEILSIVNFCDDDQSDSKKVHNSEAPNRQNRMCGQRSTWAVITESEDFREGANPPRDGVDTTPTFSIKQSTKTRRVILTLDTSGSMMTDQKLTRMRQTASNFISDGVDDDAELGLVAFSSTAHVLNAMGRINSTSVKHALLHDLPKMPRGGTSIGSGMEKALEMITRDGKNASGSVILILTDGQETQAPLISDVLPKVKDAGVIVSILAFSQNPDDNLAYAVSETGGRFYFDSNQDQSTALEDAFFDIHDSLHCHSTSHAVQLYSKAEGLWPEEVLQGTVSLDSSVGKDTQFLMTYEKDEPKLLLTSPSGRIYNKFYPEYSGDLDFKIVRINIPGIAEQGMWSFKIDNSNKDFQKVSFMVSSKPINAKEPSIRVEAALSSVNVTWPPEIIVYAEVTKDLHPVTGLTARAIVDRPFADPYEMDLLDNGAGADITKNDGVYSRFFTNFTGNGRYSVRIEVSGQGVVKQYSIGVDKVSSNTFEPRARHRPYSFVPMTSPINRVTTGGVFAFRHPNTSESLSPLSDRLLQLDQLSPSRITDLKVMQTRHEDNSIVLSWTAPGDDFDHNTASKYEIIMAPNANDLLARHSTTRYLTQDDVTRGNLMSPLPAGSLELFTLKLKRQPNSNASFVFTIRAIDDVGHKGDFSNYATAGFGFVPDYIDPEFSEIVQLPVTTEATVSGSQKIVIASVVGSFTGLLAIVIFITVFLYMCSGKPKDIHNNKKEINFAV